jgi:hypothetical protein
MKKPFLTIDSDGAARAPVPGRIRHGAWLAALIFVLCSRLPPTLAAAQELVTVNPYRVEAAFLLNFANYVTWPPHAFGASDTPWHIGVLGPDPFNAFLEHTFRGRQEKGRSFEIFRADRLEALPPCQIVFIAIRDAARRRAILDELKHQPVLTVGEASDFLKEGGIIRFQVGDRVKMSVNLDQARSASLSIQTKVLEVSDQVLENGVVRKVR